MPSKQFAEKTGEEYEKPTPFERKIEVRKARSGVRNYTLMHSLYLTQASTLFANVKVFKGKDD